MKKPWTIRGVTLILLLLVLLPLLVYTVYEISRLSESESVVAEIYRRQQDIVLFSINQYAWDVVNNWASAVSNSWYALPGEEKLRRMLAGNLLGNNRAIDALFIADTTGEHISFVATREGDEHKERSRVLALLAQEKPLLARLLQLSGLNYRKIEPVTPRGPAAAQGSVVLLFVMRDLSGAVALAGLRLHDGRFVEDVLGERLREAASGEFVISVVRVSNGERVFATEQGIDADPGQRRQLWLFPDLSAGIRLRGATIQEVARSRVSRNLAILIVLDVVLLTGVWVVYRNVRREMEFVRLKSDFVANVSHDLRTPLALIRMYAETLEMGRLRGEKKKHEYYSTIVKEAERLTRLVNNLLNFSRMEAGRRPYNLSPIDLNEAVRGVLESFSPHLRIEGFSPVVTLDPSIPPVRADAEAVQEVLVNILDNAVKYSPAGKYLRVAIGTRRNEVFVEIEDRGVGIPAEYQEKVFETFFRVPASRDHPAKGSGLGLSIARHIMDAHGGRIELKSRPGKGSTFTVVFPYGQNPHH